MEKDFTLKIAKYTVFLFLAMLACKYTIGLGAVAIVLVALGCAISGQIGWAIIAYILLPFMVVMNSWILPKTGVTGIVLRVGQMVVMLGLLIGVGKRRGDNGIPLGAMWLYVICAAISSLGGYHPLISYLKILNFSLLMLGLWLGFRNIDKSPREMETIRYFLLSFVTFLIFGSWFLRFAMPGAAYALSVASILREEGLAAASAAVHEADGMMLFCGITNQSQALATMLPMAMTWLACDMLFVERRITKFHAISILAGVPLIYMTRSRIAVFSIAVGMYLIYSFCIKRVNVAPKIKTALRRGMNFALIGVIAYCCVAEVRNKSISKLLRKNDDIAGDTRRLTEAVAESRMGKIEDNMWDFKQNPLLGTGFQVTYVMKYLYQDTGLILSAPLEKGVLPAMILGETGIVGLIAFIVFITVFYGTCFRKKYFATATLMTVFLATNMGEATYFSPGGVGGILWSFGCGGGFVLDSIVISRRREGTCFIWQQPL